MGVGDNGGDDDVGWVPIQISMATLARSSCVHTMRHVVFPRGSNITVREGAPLLLSLNMADTTGLG